MDALLASRVVVVFADETYFQRWYCLRELKTALAPFEAARWNTGATAVDAEEALQNIVVTLPPAHARPADLDRLPPRLRTTNWPAADQTDRLVALVSARLETSPHTIGELLERQPEFREMFLSDSAIPPPRNLQGIPMFPLEFDPSIGPAFVGRADDLWRIHFVLSTLRGDVATSAALTGAVEGGGGFGKTRLAREYVWRYGPAYYPSGIFWIEADADEARLDMQLHGVLRALKPEAPDLPTLAATNRRVSDELAKALQAQLRESSVLFVIDNVPEPPPGVAPRPLRHWCPGVGKVTILATSRTRISLQDASVQGLPVDILAPDAAVALLTRDVERSALDDGAWKRIAEGVGRLPLALEVLNRTLQLGGISPNGLLQRVEAGLSKEIDRQMEALRDMVPPGSLRGVTEAFQLSYERLTPEAQNAVCLIAHLAPEPIPVAVIEALEDEVPAASRMLLASRSFVSDVRGGRVPMFGRMHRLLADFLRSISSAQDCLVARLSEVLGNVMSPDACRDPKRWPLMTACLPHAQTLFDRQIRTPNERWAMAKSWLGLTIGILLGSQGFYSKARTIGERTVAWAVETLGEEHPDTLTAMNNLAGTLRAQGDLAAARTLHERVLDLRRRTLGDEHPDTFASMNNVAVTLRDQGDLAGARTLHERVVDLHRRTLGEGHLNTLRSMNNLAETLQAEGNLPAARILHERVRELLRRTLGDEHPDSLVTMNNLVETLRAEGNLPAARTLHERVLDLRRRTVGDEHPHTLHTMNNLARTLRAQGDLAGARSLYERVVDLRRRTLGEEHPDTLTSMNNLALTLSDQGDLAGARTLQKHVLDLMRRTLGEEDSRTLTSMNNLAETLRVQGDLPGAHTLHERVLDLRGRTLGEEHPDTLTSMNNLALTIAGQGDLAGARTLSERAVQIARHALGERHPQTLRYMQALAAVLEAQGEHTGATRLREEAEAERGWKVPSPPREFGR